MNITRLIFTQAFVGLVASVALLGAHAQTPVSERADMSPSGRVSVSNIAGQVTLRGWDRPEVELTGRLADDVERLDFDSDGRNVEIEVIYKQRRKKDHGWDWGRNDSNTVLDIKLPAGAELEVSTVSANINLDGHTGVQHIESVSGDIKLTLGESEADIQAVSGNISARGRDVNIEAELGSVSGDVKLVNFRGDLEIETVSGDIDLRNGVVRHAEFESVSGDIDISIRLAANGRLEMETVSGDIGLAFLGNVDARMRVNTHSGDIDSFFGQNAERTRRHGPGKRLEASTGGASADISISTLSGDVRNRSRD